MKNVNIIEARDISKTFYGEGVEVRALKKTDFSIRYGEFVAIVGHSGAGKSTLLYQLGLLDEPSTGTVMLDGVDTSLLTSNEKTSFRLTRLGYVFQNYSLMPELNAVDNIVVTLLMQGMSHPKAYNVARATIERVGLSNRMKNYPSQLSGGEQQRVSVARALAHNPIVLFADEPTANLDSVMSQRIIDYFLELNKTGQTIVMVTHEKQYSDQAGRIITLKDGQIVQDTVINPHRNMGRNIQEKL